MVRALFAPADHLPEWRFRSKLGVSFGGVRGRWWPLGRAGVSGGAAAHPRKAQESAPDRAYVPSGMVRSAPV
eukprot:13397916-Alexandrium_andersonii.AAC.1